ncbi:MAG: hypothetical protein PHV68_06810, partial [Candidatus Gastranaerophilales bacterium]|nr:hypothetical protein [Candidatus Gastranaerophilales bacterium]
MKKKILYLFKKEEKLILTGIFTGLALFIAYFALIHVNLYSTSAKLFVRNIARGDVVASYGEGTTMKSESGHSNPLFNLKQIMKSGTLSHNIYETLSEKYPQDIKKLRISSETQWNSKFNNLLEVKIEPSTDIIKVSLNWPNRKNAPQVLGLIIDEFKNTNLDIRKSVETQQSKYLDTQLTEVSDDLGKVRQELKNYRFNNNAVDIENETIELTRAKIFLEREIELTNSEVIYNRKKLEDLCAQLGMPNAQTALRATAVGEDNYLVNLNQKLSDAQQKYANMQALFTDRYPDVIAVKNEIKSLENNIQQRHEESLGNYIIKRGLYDKPSQEIVTDMARAKAEAISLNVKIKALRTSIANINNNKLSNMPLKQYHLKELLKQ